MAFRLSAVTVALAAGLIAAGCGGSGGDSSTTDTAPISPVTKQDFVQRADRICAERDKLVYQEVGRAATGQLSGTKLDRFVNSTFIPHAQLAIDRLRTLPPPATDDEQVNQIVDDAQAAVNEGKKDPSVFTDSSKSNPFAKVNQESKAYGLKAC